MKTPILILCLLILTTGPTSADELAELPFVTGMPGSLQQSVLMDGLAYCSTSAGLLVLDVSDPTLVAQVSMLPLPGFGRGIAAAAGYVYLLVWDVGLVVIDIHDPAAPQVVAVAPEPVRPSGIVLANDHAYVSDMGLGLCVVAIDDPMQPVLLASQVLSGELYGLDVKDNVAFVAGDAAGLHILDISTPSAPELIVSTALAGQVRDVAVRDGFAYLACGSFGLRVFDVKDPAAPEEVAQCSLVFDLGYPGWTGSVHLHEDHACMGILHHGLGMVDIDDPTEPLDVVLHEVRGATIATTTLNDLAYVSASHGGLAVVDIGAPSVPLAVSQFWMLGTVMDLEVEGGKLWVAGGFSPPDEKSLRNHNAGLFVVDMTEPPSPSVDGTGTQIPDAVRESRLPVHAFRRHPDPGYCRSDGAGGSRFRAHHDRRLCPRCTGGLSLHLHGRSIRGGGCERSILAGGGRIV